MQEGDALTVQDASVLWIGTPYAYPTPTKRVRDWVNPATCAKADRFACMIGDTTVFGMPGGVFELKRDGTLTWPKDLTDAAAAKYLCDLPAEDFDMYVKTAPYITALRLARPSLSPTLEAECGL